MEGLGGQRCGGGGQNCGAVERLVGARQELAAERVVLYREARWTKENEQASQPPLVVPALAVVDRLGQ